MKNRYRAIVLAVVLAVLAGMTALPVLAQEAPVGPPACPLTEGIVINVSGATWGIGLIRSDRNEAAATLGPGAAVVPPGIYNVLLAAWDKHPSGDQTQLNEQWALLGLDETGSVVFASGSTPDIPDDQTLVVATVDAGVEIAGFTQAAAIHAAFRNTDSPNSVWPICAAFVPVQTPPPTVPPSPDPVAIGDRVWEDTNADGHQADFEPGLAGVTVNLFDGVGSLLATMVTGPAGEYLFSGIPAGTYSVEVVLPAGYELGPANGAGQVSLAAGQSDLTKDFGAFKTPEVLPQIVTTTVPASVTQETLPFTGVSTAGSGGVALALILAGGLVLLVGSSRRRYGPQHRVD